MKLSKIFTDGIIKNNPAFIQLIGLCPVLAVTTSTKNALSMGMAVIFVLVMSNLVVSILRNIIPEKIRIPIFIVIIASFVTIVQMVLEAYAISIYNALGIFLPLIVVNCTILGRAESFAYKNKIVPAIVDGLGNGVGATFAMGLMGIVREFLGSGTIFDIQILPESIPTIGLMQAPPGAFILLGFFIALFKSINAKKAANA
ncbi:MAG: electron transport complex subunit RsxE [Tissierellia bacterium]|nr:electron transport complex subunit RsxE [Tissierellia bacterium]